jgi:hypothetical protein
VGGGGGGALPGRQLRHVGPEKRCPPAHKSHGESTFASSFSLSSLHLAADTRRGKCGTHPRKSAERIRAPTHLGLVIDAVKARQLREEASDDRVGSRMQCGLQKAEISWLWGVAWTTGSPFSSPQFSFSSLHFYLSLSPIEILRFSPQGCLLFSLTSNKGSKMFRSTSAKFFTAFCFLHTS